MYRSENRLGGHPHACGLRYIRNGTAWRASWGTSLESLESRLESLLGNDSDRLRGDGGRGPGLKGIFNFCPDSDLVLLLSASLPSLFLTKAMRGNLTEQTKMIYLSVLFGVLTLLTYGFYLIYQTYV